MDILVTIAIPTYKRLSYLKEAVSSALVQTYPNVEILISQDPTHEGLEPSIQRWSRALAEQNPKVRYQFNSQNLGLAGNWNALADAAQGDYIVTIGDDDRLLPDFVEKLVGAIQPGVKVAFSNHYVINAEGNRLEPESLQFTKMYHRDRLAVGKIRNPEIWVWQNAVPMSAALIRTRDVQRLRFKEDLNTPEIELFIRLAQEGGQFLFCPDYLAEYRVHDQAATASGLKVDKLLTYLLPMEVSDEVETYKQSLLSGMIVTAVSRCLMQGEIDKARELVASKYYPPLYRSTRCVLQGFCSQLPRKIGSHFYKLIDETKKKFSV